MAPLTRTRPASGAGWHPPRRRRFAQPGGGAQLLGIVRRQVLFDVGAQFADARIVQQVQRRRQPDDRPHVSIRLSRNGCCTLPFDARRNSRSRVDSRATGSCKRSSSARTASLTVPRSASSALRRTAAISSSERLTRKSACSAPAGRSA